MTDLEMLGYVDHTLLKAFATWEEIEELCSEAVEYHTASVCIPPCYINRVRKAFPGLNICTVVGFPLGYSVTESKVLETEKAIEDGAAEVDMVVNISDVKNGDYSKVEKEIAELKKAAGSNILKVIIETCYLTEEEKIAMCKTVTAAGADYIKTSTGFGTAGATLQDIELFKKHIGPDVKIKAAGGVRTLEDLKAYIDAGCSRVGASAAVKLAAQKKDSL
ncbi:deoxyribose-phosphate aldolase [Lacrimispora sp.]|uniref:deoxyribose-phosphate aldolase n=1 Tax=Lacrimispora sp. TaxID=2719234 RepID=UPI002FDB2AF1